jgi:hypothetical protein
MSAPDEPPREGGPALQDWRTMARRVHELLESHPLLQPLRDGESPVSVVGRTSSITARALPGPGGRSAIEARVREPHWWHPARDARALILAQRLAVALRERWDRR